MISEGSVWLRGRRAKDTRGGGYHVEVEDELRQVFNGVDVVVRGWRNERDSRLALPQISNVGTHLLPRQLPTLTCTEPLVLRVTSHALKAQKGLKSEHRTT
jgi:hypothetical protein